MLRKTIYLSIIMMCIIIILAACNSDVVVSDISTSPITANTTAAVQTVTAAGSAEPSQSVTDNVTDTTATTGGIQSNTATATESISTTTSSATNKTQSTTSITTTKTTTATVKPSQSKTATVKPSTATPKPSTPKPTTPTPTATTPAEVYKTITYEGKTYKVLMGRNGNKYLVKDKSTLPPQLRPYVYPFDIEGIRRDVTDYAKTKGFTTFGNPQSVMTEKLANEKCSWDNPWVFGCEADSVFDSEYTEIDSLILFRDGFQGEIRHLSQYNKKSLSIWFNPIDGNNGEIRDGKNTKQYVIYFMYGWGIDIPKYN